MGLLSLIFKPSKEVDRCNAVVNKWWSTVALKKVFVHDGNNRNWYLPSGIWYELKFHTTLPQVLLQAILCAGLYPNVAATEKGIAEVALGTLKQSTGLASKGHQVWYDGRREVHIHPSSINSSLKEFRHPFLVFLEKVCSLLSLELDAVYRFYQTCLHLFKLSIFLAYVLRSQNLGTKMLHFTLALEDMTHVVGVAYLFILMIISPCYIYRLKRTKYFCEIPPLSLPTLFCCLEASLTFIIRCLLVYLLPVFFFFSNIS